MSGSLHDAPCPTGVWFNVQPDTPKSDYLKQDNHGGPTNKLWRLSDTDNICIHQGLESNTASVDTAYTEGCIGITVTKENAGSKYGQFNVRRNYNAFKKAAGSESIIIVQ